MSGYGRPQFMPMGGMAAPMYPAMPMVPMQGMPVGPMMVSAPPIPPRPRPPFQQNAPPPPIKKLVPVGPVVTVFVGNITERAQDAMIRHMLTTCGPVISWKRVQGATGKLQAFGFCEYGNPDAGLRAIRLLHDWQVADKKLVVKVDAKTKTVLDEFKNEQRKKNKPDSNVSPLQDENNGEDDDYMDDDMKHEDKLAEERIKLILKDHEKEMASFIPSDKKRGTMARSQPTQPTIPPASANSLDDTDLEEGKKDLIHGEIAKFRETMAKREEEKEKEREKREKEKTERNERESTRKDRDFDKKMKVKSRSRSRSFSRSKSTSPERRSRSRREKRTRTRSRSRDRDRRDRDKTPPRRDPKEVAREREMEEEEKERKKAERKAREKEAAYQERLRSWEIRESKKAKEYEKEKLKEKKREEDQAREARKLKEFLEDYDDEKDDPRYYKGRELARRMIEREREQQKDNEDRQREKEEMEELKNQVLSEGHRDPSAEIRRRLEEREREYQLNHVFSMSTNNKEPPEKQIPDQVEYHSENRRDASPLLTEEDTNLSNVSPHRHYTAIDNNKRTKIHDKNFADTHSDNIPSPDNESMMSNPIPVQENNGEVAQVKKKKLDVKDVFNQDDDGADGRTNRPKLPLPPKDEGSKSSDEKRKHIKNLIDKIPTDKVALFAYVVDRDLVDNQLMEKRIRPWVNKKIAEYIGEPEPTLTDFICSKVLAGSTPAAILDDVKMVLDDEAEVFVVKMWRLLIYEIENKKHKMQLQASTSSGDK